MPFPLPSMLGSIDAVRPVFLIIMGLSLMIFTWRLAGAAADWPARLMVAGSLLLGFGYGLLLPMYEAGVIPRIGGTLQSSGSSALGWQVVKLFVMNGGWLTFGIGIAMHAKILPYPAARKEIVRAAPPETEPAPATHESVA